MLRNSRICRFATFFALLLATSAQAAPKEIVLEQPKQPRQRDVHEQAAIDNALLEGAIEVSEPYVIRTTSAEVIQSFSVDAGKCYVVSGAFETNFEIEVSYAFGTTANSESLTDAPHTGKVRMSRAGVVRFCIDRPGQVRFILRMTDRSPTQNPMQEWVLVLASRPETQEQLEARHRVAAHYRAIEENVARTQ